MQRKNKWNILQRSFSWKLNELGKELKSENQLLKALHATTQLQESSFPDNVNVTANSKNSNNVEELKNLANLIGNDLKTIYQPTHNVWTQSTRDD